MWPDVKYEPGTLRVVAYDAEGRAVAEKEVHTAGEPYRLEAVADTFALRAGTDDLCYIRVRMLDAEGNLVPDADHLVRFAVNGAGAFRAAANGDPTCTDPFQEPQMHLFSGELTAIVATTGAAGSFTFTAEADGVLPATVGRTVDEGPITSVDRLQAPGSPAIRLSAGIITVESATPCRVAVYAPDGRCVARGRGNRVDVRHLPAGIYVIGGQKVVVK